MILVRLPSLTWTPARHTASFPQPKDAAGMDVIGRPGRVLAEVSSGRRDARSARAPRSSPRS